MAIVSYPPETDKVTPKGEVAEPDEVALYGDAVAALEELLAMPAVQATGLLMPDCDLQASDPEVGPVTREHLYDFLADAQKRAGVKDVKYRKYHAGKRRLSADQDDLEAASAQAGTTGATIAKYNPRELRRQAELVVRMDRARKKRRKKRG